MTAPVIRDYLKVIGHATAGADDADLVARFAATRDEAAFELLVWRHAALVQRVCRAVLRDHHAAEDAAQATFLVLARKADSFGGRRSVVGWLYRVSRRVSVRLARQRTRLPVAAAATLDDVPARETGDAADDSADVLCAEVDRLPEVYRIPVLLCFFEGLTHAEAAHRTGWPVGTVAGRLARAKDLLARRLSRRGVGLGAIALPVASAAFVGSTARAAAAFAAGTPVTGLVTSTVLSLAQGASTTMTTTVLKLSAVAVAVLCAATAGVWGFAPPAATPPVPAGAAAASPPPLTPSDLPGGAPGPVLAKDVKPVVKDADGPQRARSANNLKQIMIAVHAYHDRHNCLPRDITDNGGKLLLSWRVHLLPYMDHEFLYKQFKLDEPWDSENNKKLLAKMPTAFRTGTEPKDGTKTYYQGFVGPGTVFEPGERLTFVGVTDGLSNTIGVIEAGPATEWTKPGGIVYDPKKPFPKLVGPFANVFMVGWMDGSAAALKPDLKDDVFRQFVERADGKIVDHDAARADVKPVAAEGPRDNSKPNAELLDRMRALQAEQQTLLAEAAAHAKRAQENAEALTRENQALKAQIAELTRQVEELKKLTPKK